MTLEDVIKAGDDLSPDELRHLRSFIDQRDATQLIFNVVDDVGNPHDEGVTPVR